MQVAQFQLVKILFWDEICDGMSYQSLQYVRIIIKESK